MSPILEREKRYRRPTDWTDQAAAPLIAQVTGDGDRLRREREREREGGNV